MTDAQEAADPTAAAAAAAAAVAAEDDGDLDSEADDTRSKLENIKYYASLFLGTVSQSGMHRVTHPLADLGWVDLDLGSSPGLLGQSG